MMIDSCHRNEGRGEVARTVFGPNDAWPTLNHKALRAEAKRAKDLGWTARQKKSHGGFVATCPAGECSVRFDSTPKIPEKEALVAKKRITSCAHAAQNQGALLRARGKLDLAELIIRAVENQLTSDELVEEAVAEEMEELLDQAAKHEEEARQCLEEAAKSSSDIKSGEALPDQADGKLREAREEIAPLHENLPHQSEVEATWRRYQGLRCRLQDVRRRWKSG